MDRRIGLARQLIDRYQHSMPLTPRPFADMARAVGATEREVLDALADLAADGALSRVGAVVPPGVLGAGTLAAMRVPEENLEETAALVSAYPEVNHNYEREHELNLWFVVVADGRERVNEVLADIERRSGLPVIGLPLERAYHVDLGFALSWN